MIDPRRCRTTSSRLSIALAFVAAVSIAVGACSPTAPTPTSSAAPTPAASVEASPDASRLSPAPPAAGQTDTDWGRIWDTVPAGFPVYPGATPAEETETGPVSATFALDGADAKSVATWVQTELERAGYSTEALNGPFEDGSYILEVAGASGCGIQVAVAPLGGLVTLGVRYGAACPRP